MKNQLLLGLFAGVAIAAISVLVVIEDTTAKAVAFLILLAIARLFRRKMGLPGRIPTKDEAKLGYNLEESMPVNPNHNHVHQQMKAKSIVSKGEGGNWRIPVDHKYAAILEVIKQDLRDMKATINIDHSEFYSLTPVEIHNFVDTFTYRFLVSDDAPTVICYSIMERQNGVLYKELDMEARVIFQWRDSDFMPITEDSKAALKRRDQNLFGKKEMD